MQQIPEGYETIQDRAGCCLWAACDHSLGMQDCTTTANGDNLEALSNVQKAQPRAHAEDGL
jgi:hypothetical protein